MPQPARSPTWPCSAAQRGRAWSVPRIRQVESVTATASPSGTLPPSLSSSWREKSTRKLAQQAPQRVQGLSEKSGMADVTDMAGGRPQAEAQFDADGLIKGLSGGGGASGSVGSRTTVTVQAHWVTTCAETLPR